MNGKYVIYHQVTGGVIKKATIYAPHRETAKKTYLAKNPKAKITHVFTV
ncbi:MULTISPECIES: hypothetical protein [Halobacillus]|nr:hypothetical protein [Halobacillus halophilus]